MTNFVLSARPDAASAQLSARVHEVVRRALDERRLVGAVDLDAAIEQRDRVRAASPESNGTWRWGGAYGHSWFVDPARALSVVALTNTLYEGMSGRFVGDLRDAVYGAGEA